MKWRVKQIHRHGPRNPINLDDLQGLLCDCSHLLPGYVPYHVTLFPHSTSTQFDDLPVAVINARDEMTIHKKMSAHLVLRMKNDLTNLCLFRNSINNRPGYIYT